MNALARGGEARKRDGGIRNDDVGNRTTLHLRERALGENFNSSFNARGARINTRWQGNGRESRAASAYKFPARCRFLRNYRPSKVAPPPLAIFREQQGGGAHTRKRNSSFPALFCAQKYSRSVFLSHEPSPFFHGSPRGCIKLCKK